MASSDSHQADCTHDQESPQEVTVIDPDGDLTLVVGSTKTRFLVCSKALSRSAPFWKRCLYGQFKEAKAAGDKEWIVEFPEDNPSALKYILLLAHGLGHKLPEVNLQLAFEVTVLTNKYAMTRLLWAVARSWLDDLEPPAPDEGDDDTVVPQLQWLWVAQQLGGIEEYIKTFVELSQIVSTAAEGDGSLNLRPYQPGDGSVVARGTLDGYDAEKDVILLLADEIRGAREHALISIQNVLREDIKTLRDAIRTFDSSEGCKGAVICKGQRASGLAAHSNRRRLCEYAMQAIVAKISATEDSAVKPVAKIGLSGENYLASAICFSYRIKREIGIVCGDEHKECTPFTSKLPSQEDLKLQIRVITWRCKGMAFEKQARISGLEKGGESDDDEEQGHAGRKRSRDEFEAAAST